MKLNKYTIMMTTKKYFGGSWDIAQVMEHLPHTYKALSSNSCTENNYENFEIMYCYVVQPKLTSNSQS
jgi:hypothetical protein